MKRFFKSYTSFTRRERTGLIGLMIVIILLIALKATMHLWVKPPEDAAKQQQLANAWETFKGSSSYRKASDENDMPLPDTIDLNTADSATLVRLKGIGPVTAHKIIERREHEGPFTDYGQLLEIRHFPKMAFDTLKMHLRIQ